MKAPFAGVFRSLRSFNYRVWAARRLRLQRRHLGAAHGPGLAGAHPAHPPQRLRRRRGHGAAVRAAAPAAALDRLRRRPFQPAQAADRHPGGDGRASPWRWASSPSTGVVQLWHVYVFAFLFGCAAAFDAPARQTFVAELVGEADLPNAVALNSTSFNAARMIGPAVAGVVIAAIGTGWAFLINGASFVAVLLSLAFLRVAELHPNARAPRGKGSFAEGFRYVWGRPDLKAILVMLFLIGTFGLNFPIFISTMAVGVFHADARGYGLLSSIMAIGTVAGALLERAAAKRPRFSLLLVGAGVFGLGCALAALAPSYWFFAGALVVIGVAALTFTNTTNSLMQLSTEPAMRGRVMALRVGIALGGTPIGAPIVGWVADAFGPRWALGVGAASGFAAAAVAVYVLARQFGRPVPSPPAAR